MKKHAAFTAWAQRFPPGPLWAARHYCHYYVAQCAANDSAFVLINHVDRIEPGCNGDDETVMRPHPTAR